MLHTPTLTRLVAEAVAFNAVAFAALTVWARFCAAHKHPVADAEAG
jgi:hypothetical protein